MGRITREETTYGRWGGDAGFRLARAAGDLIREVDRIVASLGSEEARVSLSVVVNGPHPQIRLSKSTHLYGPQGDTERDEDAGGEGSGEA